MKQILILMVLIFAANLQGFSSEVKTDYNPVKLEFISNQGTQDITPFREGSTVNDRRGNYMPLAIGGTITLAISVIGLVGSGLAIGFGWYMIFDSSFAYKDVVRGTTLMILGGVFVPIFGLMFIAGLVLTIVGWALHAKYSKWGSVIDIDEKTGDMQLGLTFKF